MGIFNFPSSAVGLSKSRPVVRLVKWAHLTFWYHGVNYSTGIFAWIWSDISILGCPGAPGLPFSMALLAMVGL